MPLTLLRVVAVLVALVVPLQGMASVMAAQCMASAHHDAPVSHADESHDGHGDGHEASSAPESKSSHCGPCAACCASASMAAPSITNSALAAAAAEAPSGFAPLPPARLAPHLLDRPPLAL